jgi:hypothetical protein
LLELFKQFSAEVGFVGIGVAARSAQLTQTMGEKLLRLHMKSENQMQKAKVISEALNTKFFHHGYPVSRTEAKDIGLPVAAPNPQLEELIWSLWLDIEEELKFREPFLPVRILRDDPSCAGLFGPTPAGTAPIGIGSAPFERIVAVMESLRTASRYMAGGSVLGVRQPDLSLRVSVVGDREGWIDEALPPAPPVQKKALPKGQKKVKQKK